MHIDPIIHKLNGNLDAYKPIPFWSWNGKLEQTRLNAQIDLMKSYGMGGFFMHARSGLQTEYFSDSWLDAVKSCADYGKSSGLSAWLYDENGYPSGFAGGALLNKQEYHDQYLTHTVGAWESDADYHYQIRDDSLILTHTANAAGEYLNLYIHNSVGTADVCNQAVTEQFITLTHQRYKDFFGDNFSEKISGIFTDEPQYYSTATAYTRVMPDYYQHTYGENLFDGLGLLFIKKQGWRKFRYRYWKAMQQLLLHNYAKKVYDWCEQSGVKLTGHYVEESSLGFQLKFCGGIMPLYEYLHIPGIDWLGTATDNELSPRQIASAAAQLGKKRILTESFACCGWQVKPKSLKRIAEFQFLHGVNLLCHHLVPYSEYGIRKHDHPAHYGGINPWLTYEFHHFNDYFTKLGFLMAESEEKVNAALLHPLRSAYFDYDAADFGDHGHVMGLGEQDAQLRQDLRSLSSKGIAYHFLDETLLEKYGYVDGKKIGCGKKAYDYLILPHITAMDASTEALLHQYAANGGKLLILGDVPQYVAGEAFDFSYLRTNCSMQDIVNAQAYHIANTDTALYQAYRQIDGMNFLFVLNTSQTESFTQRFSFDDDTASFDKLELNTMQVENIPLEITLAPEESALLFLSKEQPTVKEVLPIVPLTFRDAAYRIEQNYFPIDMVSYAFDGVHFCKAYPCESLAIKLGKEQYQGEITFQYRFTVRSIPEKIFLQAEQGNGLQHRLNGRDITLKPTVIAGENRFIADISSHLILGENEYTVKLYWYQSDQVQYILKDNRICGSLGNMLTYDSEISPIHLVGDFGVYFTKHTEGDNGYLYADGFYIDKLPDTITEPVTDGLPFYAGKLSLMQKFIYDQRQIAISIPGTQLLTYVKINGQTAGKLLFDQSLDISAYTQIGKNTVEAELTLSNRNLYGPFHFNGITHFGVGPDSWDMRGGEWRDKSNPFIRDSFELLKLFYQERWNNERITL